MANMFLLGRQGEGLIPIASTCEVYNGNKLIRVEFTNNCGRGMYNGRNISIKEIDILAKKIITPDSAFSFNDVQVMEYPNALISALLFLKKNGLKTCKLK